jgi:hypothetical protein
VAAVSAVLLALTALPFPAAQAGTPTVNGLFYGDGDYNNYLLWAVAPEGRGTLYYSMPGDTLYLAVVVDDTINDNVFGRRKQGQNNYDQDYYESAGWNSVSHQAQDLIQSDHLQMTMHCGDSSWTWVQDYVWEDDPTPDGYAHGKDWISDPYGPDAVAELPDGRPPSGFLSSASSMAWNLNNSMWDVTLGGTRDPYNADLWKSADDWFDSTGATGDSSVQNNGYPYWDPVNQYEWAMVYEMAIDISNCTDYPVIVWPFAAHNSPVKNGESEDVPFEPDSLADWGDAPDPSYPTLTVSNGARHWIRPGGPMLGAQIDAEGDGLQDALALGDDAADGNDDEDGVVFAASLVPGATVGVVVTANMAGYLNAWLDYNQDGDWVDSGEKIFSDVLLAAGANNLSFSVPLTATTGFTFARFRFASFSGLSYDGIADDGEVEDYRVEIVAQALDYGDAVDPSYPTLLASNGARHVLDGSTYLGAMVDADADGRPNLMALGDDNDDGSDDEDGVVFIAAPGSQTNVQVTASVAGVLTAWIDFTDDGDWDDANEHIFNDVALSAGVNLLSFNVPAGSSSGMKYARFRFSTLTGLGYDGLASNGEVEDYLVSIDVPVELGSFSASMEDGAVRLAWTTQSESDNLGFQVYRSDEASAGYEKLTDELIPAAGNSQTVRDYSYLDDTVEGGMTYYYKLADVSVDGLETLHGPIEVRVSLLPNFLSLDTPVPNPMVRQDATIQFSIPSAGMTRLVLYDLAGRELTVLADGMMQPGSHNVKFGRADARGNRLPAGLYFLRLLSPSGVRSQRILLVD